MSLATETGANMQTLCAIADGLGIPHGDDSAPSSRFISANGLRMNCVDWGHDDKPPLLFLHGAALTAHTFDLVCLNLREDYHCIALDQRGHGLTDGVHAFGVEQPRDDIRAAVAALGLERFVLIGMSMGGNNAIAYAGEDADKLAGLVLVDVCPTVLPTGYQDALDYSAAIARSHSFEEAVDAAQSHNPRGTREFKRYTLSYSLEQVEGGNWRLRYERDPTPADMQGADYMAGRREALSDLARRIEKPVLIVHGEESLAQSRDNLERFRQTLPDGRLVCIPGASHDVQEDKPLALIEALREFLDGIDY